MDPQQQQNGVADVWEVTEESHSMYKTSGTSNPTVLVADSIQLPGHTQAIQTAQKQVNTHNTPSTVAHHIPAAQGTHPDNISSSLPSGTTPGIITTGSTIDKGTAGPILPNGVHQQAGSQPWRTDTTHTAAPMYDASMNTSFGVTELPPLSAQLQPQATTEMKGESAISNDLSSNDMGGITISSPQMNATVAPISIPVTTPNIPAGTLPTNNIVDESVQIVTQPVVSSIKVATPPVIMSQQALAGTTRGSIPNITPVSSNPMNPPAAIVPTGNIPMPIPMPMPLPTVLASTPPPLLPPVTSAALMNSTPAIAQTPVIGAVAGVPMTSQSAPVADASAPVVPQPSKANAGGIATVSSTSTPASITTTSIIHQSIPQAQAQIVNTDTATGSVTDTVISTPAVMAKSYPAPGTTPASTPAMPASVSAPRVISQIPMVQPPALTQAPASVPTSTTNAAATPVVPVSELPYNAPAVGVPTPVQVPVPEVQKVGVVPVSVTDPINTPLPVAQPIINTPQGLQTGTNTASATDTGAEARSEPSTVATAPAQPVAPTPLVPPETQIPPPSQPQPPVQPLPSPQSQGQPLQPQQPPQHVTQPQQPPPQQVPHQPQQAHFYGQLPGVVGGGAHVVKVPSGNATGNGGGGKVNHPSQEKASAASTNTATNTSGARVKSGSPVPKPPAATTPTTTPGIDRSIRGPVPDLRRVPSRPGGEYRPVNIAPFPAGGVKVGSPPAHHSGGLKNNSGTPVYAASMGPHAPPPPIPKTMKRPYYKPISAAPGPGSGQSSGPNTPGVGGEQRNVPNVQNVQMHPQQQPHVGQSLTPQVSQGDLQGSVESGGGGSGLPTPQQHKQQQPTQSQTSSAPPQPSQLPPQQAPQGPGPHPRTPIAAGSIPGNAHPPTQPVQEQQQQTQPPPPPPPPHTQPPQNSQPQRQLSSGALAPHPSGGVSHGDDETKLGENRLKAQTSQPSAQPTAYLARPAPPPVGSSLAAMAPANTLVHVSSNSLSNSTEREPQQQQQSQQQQADEQHQQQHPQQQRPPAKGTPQPSGHHGGYQSMGARQHSGHLPYNGQQHMGRPGPYPESYGGAALAGKPSGERMNNEKIAPGPKTPGGGPTASKIAPNPNAKVTPPGAAYTKSEAAARPPYSVQSLQRGSSGSNLPPNAPARGPGYVYESAESAGAPLSGPSSHTHLNAGNSAPGEADNGNIHPDAGKFFPQLSESELDNIPHQTLSHPANGSQQPPPHPPSQQPQPQGPSHGPPARGQTQSNAPTQKIVPSQQQQKQQQQQQQHSMQYTMELGPNPSRGQSGPGRRRSGTGASPSYTKAQEQAMQQQQVQFHTGARGLQREYGAKGKRGGHDDAHLGSAPSGGKRTGSGAGRKHGATGEQQGGSKRGRRYSYSDNEFDTVDEDAEHHAANQRPVFQRKRPSILGHQPHSFFTQRDPEVTGGINVPGHYLKPTLFRAPDEDKRLKRMLKGASTDGRLEGKRMKAMMQNEGLGQVLEIENRVTETLNKLQESLDKMTSTESDGRIKNGTNITKVDVAVNRLKSLVEKNLAASKTVTGHTKDVVKLSEKLMNHEPTCKLLVKQYALGSTSLS